MAFIEGDKCLKIFALDIELNAQGLESWLDAEGAPRAKKC